MAFRFKDLVIFEMANNHQGRLEHGLQIVEEMAGIAREYGIRAAVKLQYRDLETLIHPEFAQRTDVPHIPRFLATRLSWGEYQTLVAAIRDHGLTAVVTAFDEPSVEMALNHGADILKVASCSCLDWPLLETVARAGKPILCSTGGCRLADVDRIVTFLEHRQVADLALLHCVALYPTPDAQQHLGSMQRLMRRFPQWPIGYSGHEAPDNLRVVIAAVAMGARILERHVGLPSETVTLNAYSMNPQQTRRWVEEILAARSLCGDAEAEPTVAQAEIDSLRSLQRGVFARRAIRQGEPLEPGSVFFAMPCRNGQTAARDYTESLLAAQDYVPGEAIEQRRPVDSIQILRSVAHEAKGLLREAQIPVGPKYQVELSHHFGIESIRRCGAVMIDLFNREYCKKLIILLPGQSHPAHAHKAKEETFQLLYGEMEITVDGQSSLMRPGDTQLIRRGQYHAFSTRTGCVLEEISTTHVRGDSIYSDARIQRLDPIERKTVIQQW